MTKRIEGSGKEKGREIEDERVEISVLVSWCDVGENEIKSPFTWKIKLDRFDLMCRPLGWKSSVCSYD